MNKGPILCVDDDPDVLKSIETILSTEGYATLKGNDGQEGLEVFQENRKKLWGIFVDAKMPRMNGLDLAKEVRKADPKLPIILVTAYLAGKNSPAADENITVKQYHDAGINGHIEKPFSLDNLMEAVHISFDTYAEKHLQGGPRLRH